MKKLLIIGLLFAAAYHVNSLCMQKQSAKNIEVDGLTMEYVMWRGIKEGRNLTDREKERYESVIQRLAQQNAEKEPKDLRVVIAERKVAFPDHNKESK